MRPEKSSPAHVTDGLAELVCSNSFRSDDSERNAVGLLHAELRRAGSLIMQMADKHALPAGGALAVDRIGFSEGVTAAVHSHPLIAVEHGEITGLPPEDWGDVIIATGPLTSEPLAKAIQTVTGEEALSFFDAIAPIVHGESINMEVVWAQSRYDKPGPSGTGADYLNCPMTEGRIQPLRRCAAVLGTARIPRMGEGALFRRLPCRSREMASRGRETLRFGPMKPIGLTNPRDPETPPYAVVQLRQDNAFGTLWNMVGFQTKMKYRGQTEIFRLIPGLEEAQFARLGGLHHNTFLNSPKVLRPDLKLKTEPRLRFAGQITGVEGYVESTAIGLMAGRFAAAERLGQDVVLPPPETALGALIGHITGGHLGDEGAKLRSFQPMNVNFGLFPPVTLTKPEGVKRWRGKDKAVAKKLAITSRALAALETWV